MPYIGNSQVAGVHQNNFKILDDISSYTETFVGSSSSIVDTTNNTITVPQHRFFHGQRVTYNNGGGSNIGGLTSGTVYYAVADSHQTIKLAASLADALSNTVINISSVGSGSSHTLNSSFDGVSKKFKLTHSGGIGVNLTNASHATVAINNVVQRPNLNDASFTEGFAIEGGKVIVFKTAPTSTDTFWGNTIAEAVSTFDTTVHTVDSFTADGVATNFSLSKEAISVRDIHVTLDGVTQHTTAFSLQGNVLIFSTAPANGTAIQVKHMGFVGATTSGVTGFYGRLGNVALQDGDVLRGDGSLITGLDTGIPGISTSGTSHFNNLNLTGVSTLSGNAGVDFNDNVKARFGTNNNLEIYHNPVNSYIANNSNNLFITNADGDIFIQAKAGENSIICNDDGSVQLYHDDVLKCQTRDYGFSIFQDLNISNNLNVAGVSTFSSHLNADGNISIENTEPKINFLDTNANPDYRIRLDGGIFKIEDISSGIQNRFSIGLDGSVAVSGNLNANSNLNVNGNLDVDGHTELDNLRVSGVSTFAGDLSVAENIVHTGDTDTKIHFDPTGNTIEFFTNGTQKLVIGQNGSVGIGTWNPETRLDVYHDNTTTGGLIQISQKGSGAAAINFRIIGDQQNNLGFYNTIAEWTAGVDNSDNEKFKISTTSGLGGSGDVVAITTAGNVSVAKDFDVNAGMTVAGVSTFSDVLSAANYGGLKTEDGSVNVGSLNGDFNIDLGTDGHVYTAPATTGGNYTPNFRFNSTTTLASKMNIGDVVSSTLIVDSSSHYCTSSIKIDGNSETVEWVGGSAPSSANGSGYDIYSFTIVKVNNNPTYIVIGNAISAA